MGLAAKFFLRGMLILGLGIIFMIWGLSDIFSVISDPTIRFVIVLSVILILVIIIATLFAIIVVKVKKEEKKHFFLNKKNWIYKCVECGEEMNLADEFCNNCGVENTKRKEALTGLEEYEQLIKDQKAKIKEKQKSPKRLDEVEKVYLRTYDKEKEKVKHIKRKLLFADSHERELEWVREQYYENNKKIHEIAKELGLEIATIQVYLEELNKKEKNM